MVEQSLTKFSLDSIMPIDLISFGSNPSLTPLLNGEKLLFADKVDKINLWGWS
jgi:hypothetical protein